MFDFRHNIGETIEALHTPKKMGLPSGLTELDEILWGFDRGELITIGARPGIGKSSLGRKILLSAGNPKRQDGVGILCTLEMTCSEISQMIASTTAKINYGLVRRGRVTGELMSRLGDACTLLSTYNMIINDDCYITPDTLRQLLSDVMEHEPVSCLIVDYLQLMSLRKKVDNRQTEISEISRELKVIAMEFNIPVIAFSQLNRNAEYRESARPRITDLRESGAMDNDSDKIILIHRPGYYNLTLGVGAEDDGEVEFIICKNRRGSLGTAKAVWIAESMSFYDTPSGEF